MRKLRHLAVLAVCAAALGAPTAANAIGVVVTTAASPIPGTDQFAWSCVGRAAPPIDSFTLTCNDQRAVGIYPILAAAGLGTGTAQVCYRWTMRIDWTSYTHEGCSPATVLPPS